MVPPLLVSRSDAQPAGFRELSPLAALHHLGDVRLVDVREEDEFLGPLGHLPGAELVPVAAIAAAAEPWDREAPLLLICRSGARSARAATTLAATGFRQVLNLTGGMLAWDAGDLPRVHGSAQPLADLAERVRACFIAATGGDVHAGTRAFHDVSGPQGSTEGLGAAIRALGSIRGVEADERARWVADLERRLLQVRS